MYETIDYHCDDDEGVGTITLNRPHCKNAIDIPMRTELRDLVERLRYDRGLRALIITGAGGNFCSGGDLSALQAEVGKDSADVEARRQRLVDLQPLVAGLIQFDRPVIAAVTGVAFGAGLGLALAADFILAADDARFCAVFGRVGAVPDFGTFYTLPRAVGVQRARELVYSAREIGAAEALAMGLVLEVHAPQQLLGRARAIARSLAQASQATLSISKRALNVSCNADLQTMLAMESDGQGIALSTAYHDTSVKRFLAKEGPMFRWPERQA